MKGVLTHLKVLFVGSVADIFAIKRWRLFLAAGILSTLCAGTTYHLLPLSQHYSELIVGNLAWNFEDKFRDYAVLFSFVGGFFVFLVALSALMTRVARKVAPDTEENFDNSLVLLSTPAGVWFAGLLTTHSASLGLLVLSWFLLLVALILIFLLTLKPQHYWNGDSRQFFRVLHSILLALFAVGFARAAIGIGVNRIGAVLHSRPWLPGEWAYHYLLGPLILSVVAVICLVFKSSRPDRLEQIVRRSTLLLQVFFPAFFLLLIPTPWLVGRRLSIGYPLSGFAWVLIGSCVILAYVDLLRCYRSNAIPSTTDPVESFSLMCLIGVILFLKEGAIPIPAIPADDYHFGEVLVPWWSLAQHHLIPFVDYSPPRGLVDYSSGVVASLFFDGKASSFIAVQPFICLGILLVALPVLARSIGKGPAVLALLLMPSPNTLSEIDVLVTVFICLVSQGFQRWKPEKWLVVWGSLDMAILLCAPGQGALAILATAPLALFMVYRSYVEDRRSAMKMILVFVFLFFAMALATPFGRMLLGAIRYGLEQSGVNSIAHGIAWRDSFATSDNNPWLYEMMRASWLLVALWAGVLLLRIGTEKTYTGRSAAAAYAVPIFFLTVLFIIRAAGRIDVGITRLGFASIWGLSLLLPLLLFTGPPGRARGDALFVWLLLAGILYPHFGGPPTDLSHAFDPIRVQMSSAGLVNGSSIGLPQLGSAVVNPIHLARLSAIESVLDAVLDPRETYLDLTGRHAHYFYLNRRPPIETGSVYNLVTETQQLRAISRLSKDPPPAVLIGAENMLGDGTPASLRSNLLYRYLLLQPDYRVALIGNQTWLIRKDRLARISGMDVISISNADDSSTLIQDIFGVPDLRSIPASWGRSFTSLKGGLRLVRLLSNDEPRSLNSVTDAGNGHYLVNGPNPSVRFDISDWHLKGSDVSIVAFDFACEQIKPSPIVTIRWTSSSNGEGESTALRFRGRNGRMVVPVDAMPAWLLAKDIRSIRFGVSDRNSCRAFWIENVGFFQRRASDTVRYR